MVPPPGFCDEPGCDRLFVSALGDELRLFVSAADGELRLFVSGVLIEALSVPLCELAGVPVPVVSVAVVSVAPISPVSLWVHPAKQMKVAANNANFFIFILLVCASQTWTESLVAP